MFLTTTLKQARQMTKRHTLLAIFFRVDTELPTLQIKHLGRRTKPTAQKPTYLTASFALRFTAALGQTSISQL
jgi:hypothetical protein